MRYEDRVPAGMRPEDLMAALAEYVDFRPVDTRLDVAPPPAFPSPPGDISQLRKGMLRIDAERAFGRSLESSQRREGSLSLTTLVFVVGEQRITADFIEVVLVRYTMTSK